MSPNPASKLPISTNYSQRGKNEGKSASLCSPSSLWHPSIAYETKPTFTSVWGIVLWGRTQGIVERKAIFNFVYLSLAHLSIFVLMVKKEMFHLLQKKKSSYTCSGKYLKNSHESK